MTTKIQLSILIIEYNSEKWLCDCLDSIMGNIRDEISYEVIVVDNYSGNKLGKNISDKYPSIEYIANKKNLGFGDGNNVGAAKANGDYLLLINPDTIVIGDAIQQLYQYISSHPKYGIIGPRLIQNTNGEEENDYYGDFPTLKSLLLRNNHTKIEETKDLFAAERISGACMMMKKEIFDRVGGFDSDYFMYFEDTDLCQKISNLGYRIAVLKKSSILHFGGKAHASTKQKKLYYYASQNHYFQKHYGLFQETIMKIARWPLKMLKTR